MCLPSSLSPELNPIEHFWAIVKGKVRRSQFGNTEDLKTRITEACEQVPRNHLPSATAIGLPNNVQGALAITLISATTVIGSITSGCFHDSAFGLYVWL
ncbi:hypothetical protein INT45_005372 [Circinella minor]|uniref:Tc1-like transposase DDE domain-containing protein n=1 Tax=Circinella minor TaxID=1195481 RepID=A0A8H7RYJ1_9FUNG|nr:hypothetical protein INT45_005372 [Circinella minor]